MKIEDIDIYWNGVWRGFGIDNPFKYGLGLRSRYINFAWFSIKVNYKIGKRRKQTL